MGVCDELQRKHPIGQTSVLYKKKLKKHIYNAKLSFINALVKNTHQNKRKTPCRTMFLLHFASASSSQQVMVSTRGFVQ